MTESNPQDHRQLLIMVAGIKGAVASTLALAVSAMQNDPDLVRSSLTTGARFPHLPPPESTAVAGWDISRHSMADAAACQQILPDSVCRLQQAAMDRIEVRTAPPAEAGLREQVDRLMADIDSFRAGHRGCMPVFVNLLPAAPIQALDQCRDLEELYRTADAKALPDLAYTIAAVRSGIALVNFTPNAVELPFLIREAESRGVPVAGRDGKTGQTYLKVVLASALKARSLTVDGWYSLNILGNEDGRNLMEPERAAGKVANKTDLLNDILGYPVGERYGRSTHTVRIDYYPPRGDAKEAWDVVDFRGIFGLPMTLRLNLQGRDSILAAPLVLDLARWMAAVQSAGIGGAVPELGFYFKKPVGPNPPVRFEEQLAALTALERRCMEGAQRT
jgi:myo-inositol-1-phosphate synthase